MKTQVLDEQTVAERLRLPVEVLRRWRELPAGQECGPRWITVPQNRDRQGRVEPAETGYEPRSVESFKFSGEHAKALHERVRELEAQLTESEV